MAPSEPNTPQPPAASAPTGLELGRTSNHDCTLRAITNEGGFRAITIRMTDTVREIVKRQHAQGEAARALGELLLLTVLFRETMSPNLRVQGIVKSKSGGTLVADSAPEGKTRGLLQADSDSFHLRDGGLIQMMRTMPNGSVNQGVVRIEPGDSLSQGAMAYMKQSEQVDSMVAVKVTLNDQGEVLEAGGFLVQLLPEIGKGPLAVMAQRLEEFESLEQFLTPQFSPLTILEELLYGMEYTQTDESPVEFHCWCSESRMLAAIATIDKKEIQDMVDAGKAIEIDCDYCGKEYALQPSTLQGLLAPS
ncbi:MAG: Hsp33 family molecular chaperone HslO [Polyangiaceae bacterium]|nr:Hsp33 family molecular chaperone HslO [Polyangiaceae bacterium]